MCRAFAGILYFQPPKTLILWLQTLQEESLTRQKAEVRRKLRERRVPSSPIGRVFGFAQLGASLVYGTMSDSVSQYFRGGSEGAAGGPKANNTGNKCAPIRV